MRLLFDPLLQTEPFLILFLSSSSEGMYKIVRPAIGDALRYLRVIFFSLGKI